MSSLLTLYTAAALMAIVALACSALSLAWLIPSWRLRLGERRTATITDQAVPSGLTGWQARFGNGLIAIGLAACTACSWYGCYTVLSALSSVAN